MRLCRHGGGAGQGTDGGFVQHKLLAFTAIVAIFAMPASSFSAGDHAVKGRITKSGNVVAPTRATNPNTTQRDNYGAAPNVNPATGKQGKRIPTK